MLANIYFLSAERMSLVPPRADSAVISILDPSDEQHRPSFEGFHASLALGFSDWAEEFAGAEIGSWSDEPTAEMHGQLAAKGETLPALSDAEKIVSFVEDAHMNPDVVSLYVHCMGGISRSAAVAVWASAKLRVPIANEDSAETPNPRLLRLLYKADEMRRLRERSAFFRP